MAMIRQLPQSVINKIAAGEVVERPASVVKELVENSLDAGATRVEVSVAQGGMDLVRIVDDGHGIPAEQLPLAVASHATSKLATADDLFRVSTLGFRGEALASIAEVSHFTMRSRTADATAGAELEVVAGQARPVAPCGCATGTAIEVRNLFVNTPVRRKFLRSTQTEMGHVTEAFTRLALASPHVHFVLRHNERLVYDLPPSQDWRERIGAFFGPELSDALIWIDSADEPIRLAGYVAHPSQSRGNTRMQYLFLNGRYVRDRSLQHRAGRGLSRSALDRALSDFVFVLRHAGRNGRRERASHQARSSLPGRRPTVQPVAWHDSYEIPDKRPDACRHGRPRGAAERTISRGKRFRH